jgi:hypothetical protein
MRPTPKSSGRGAKGYCQPQQNPTHPRPCRVSALQHGHGAKALGDQRGGRVGRAAAVLGGHHDELGGGGVGEQGRCLAWV